MKRKDKSTRTHNKSHFFKFMTSDTAKIVLKNSSLRWREPKQFNDPFDHQMSFKFSFEPNELTELLQNEVKRLIFKAPQEPLETTLLSTAIKLLRKTKGIIPESEILQAIDQGCIESQKNFLNYQKKINSLIENDLNDSRVLCISEANTNVVMWSHYAEEHKGVCLKLNCIDEIDNTLLVAKPVVYQESFPMFPSLKDFVDELTGIRKIDFGKLLYQIPFVKHKDWAYEREWRIHIPNTGGENKEGFDDWKEDPNVFGAIYLGCRIKKKDILDIIEIAKELYPQIEIFQTVPRTDGFALDFKKLK